MGYKRYYIYKKEYSDNGGATWNDVVPSEITPSGSPLGEYSTLVECEGDLLDYLCTEAIEDDFRIQFKRPYKSGTTTMRWYIEYSIDNRKTWHRTPSGKTYGDEILTSPPSINAGEKIWWRGNLTTNFQKDDNNTRDCGFTQDYIADPKKYKVYGNALSLNYGSKFASHGLSEKVNYPYLFRYTNVVDASGLILPSVSNEFLGNGFRQMFNHCTYLVTPPSLSASTLVGGDMSQMFLNCTSLTGTPIFTSVSLGTFNMSSMFSGCISLTNVSLFPENIDGNSHICTEMFKGCTSLTSVPINLLPATTLTGIGCYHNMFYGCTNLTAAPELPATSLAESCYDDMFEGCTSLTTAPQILPATTLAESCYDGMFRNCTSLTTAPELPARLVTDRRAYYYMFHGCININYIKCYATEIGSGSTEGWVGGVSPTGTFYKNPAMRSWTRGGNGIPTEWIVEDYVPEPTPEYDTRYLTLVAQGSAMLKFDCESTHNNTIQYSLDNGSTWSSPSSSVTVSVTNGQKVLWKGTMIPGYGIGNFSGSIGTFSVEGNIMSLLYGDNFTDKIWFPEYRVYYFSHLFANCTGLTSAEDLTLPAEMLEADCYYGMFYGCTNLTAAPELPATILAGGCYFQMFAGCTSLTTAPELPATTLTEHCYYRMFSGCTSLNEIKCYAKNISAYACTSNWVKNVASSGTFVKASSMGSWGNCSTDRIPCGWTVQDAT